MTEKTPSRKDLASVAYQKALLPFHGFVDGRETNLEPLIRLFPRWNVRAADGSWCAAFVYYCLVETGFRIPYSPDECITCSLVGCGGFEEFAMGDARIEYYRFNGILSAEATGNNSSEAADSSHSGSGGSFCPEPGDIVIFDNVFPCQGHPFGQEHDHIGIIVGLEKDCLLVAEGNVPGTNTSGIVQRKLDSHIRCCVRIPDGYHY